MGASSDDDRAFAPAASSPQAVSPVPASIPSADFTVCPIWKAIIQNVGYSPHPWDIAREGSLTGVDKAVLAIREIIAADKPIAGAAEHMWFDPGCAGNGCQSLVWKSRYEAAVRGRQDFRNSYRDQMELNKELIKALKVARTWSDKDWVGYEIVEAAIVAADRTKP